MDWLYASENMEIRCEIANHQWYNPTHQQQMIDMNISVTKKNRE